MRFLKYTISMLLILVSTLNLFAYEFSGKIKQTSGNEVTIEVYCEDEIKVYKCEKRHNIFMNYSIFSLDLKPNKFYTIYFISNNIDKIVYVDTRRIRSINSYICKLKGMDSIIYYDSITAKSVPMSLEYLEWVNKNFVEARDYKYNTSKINNYIKYEF